MDGMILVAVVAAVFGGAAAWGIDRASDRVRKTNVLLSDLLRRANDQALGFSENELRRQSMEYNADHVAARMAATRDVFEPPPPMMSSDLDAALGGPD